MSAIDLDFDGYQILHGQESWGDDFFGMKIFVKLSARKIDREDSYGDVGKAIRALEEALRTRTAQLDPKGAEQRAAYRKEVEDAYAAAGVTAVYVEPLPNGYCDRPCCLNRPWFRVTSSIGHVVVGRRKRVFSIDWKDSLVKKTGQELFPDEDVTRLETGIHAWGTEKLVEYLRRLHETGAQK